MSSDHGLSLFVLESRISGTSVRLLQLLTDLIKSFVLAYHIKDNDRESSAVSTNRVLRRIVWRRKIFPYVNGGESPVK